MRASFHAYWGKAGEGETCHLLPYHCLDVAACGVTLLKRLPRWRRRLVGLSGMGEDTLLLTLRVFLPLHDLGKFATAFQNLRPDLLERLRHRRSAKGYPTRHDTLGYALWREQLRSRFGGTGRRRRTSDSPADPWMRVVTGHHGQPPGESLQGLLRDHFEAEDIEAAEAFLQAVLELTGVESLPKTALPPEATWWLAGLTVLADWLGSNAGFFPYCEEALPLHDYWDRALKQAEKAVEAAGLNPDPPSGRFTLGDCFADPPANLKPTPLQRWAETVALDAGPSLFILEDVTGAGKTEAALLLAQRLLREQGGGGLYFGLPTMATANGMYQRLGGGEPPVYCRLFAPGSHPSLVLAHSRAELVRGHLLPPPEPEGDYGDSTEAAANRCSAWLADNRKKALLAEVGVGTIDQALLAVLASRHQSLRLLGLLDKVLIADEVHACDAYMNRLLEHLLRAHAGAGGSAILLSATLPHRQKTALIEAFAAGLGREIDHLEPSKDYPLATVFDRNGIRIQPLETRPEVARQVAVEFIEREEQVETVLADAVSRGCCACWICNTVDDARRRFEQLVQTHPDWKLDLFHARFTLHDRMAVERRVLRNFGKRSGPAERRGRVLIATQVVEQSLDLDFDVLISDLAPIDLLVQRAGRLQRHPRDKEGRYTPDATDRRGIPKLIVLAPPWDDDPPADWLRQALPGTAAVYEAEDAHLWLGMKLLRERRGFGMPGDARFLIEGVYDTDPFVDFPEALQAKALEAETTDKCKATIGEDKVLHLESGYRLEGPWLDEDIAPTRLGEPTTTVWLARLAEGRLLPLHSDSTAPEAWLESSLTLRQALARYEVIPDGVSPEGWQKSKEDLPGRGKWGVVIALNPVTENFWEGQVQSEQPRIRTIVYSQTTGLAFKE
ncbi:CRISPR-associated endonuclease/helicase Cas3 [Methylomarinovum tepidoasis]|uniref:CRISPR-associated endonuclease/helicase Cas3 n=1 Tax=Methylomarinovum tepidoasis TaxID=2840183 RepID=A0AAU9CD74_9GAMM|nr:CRISPR-associated helicase Cas3' [Methylomarinovum sp. IN45]BCX89972.1 CRISPR-associated endonuclease/helicase Cas3 [Methylomarinovum sp. IN45]